MANLKGTAGRKTGMNVDTALVRELAELLNETGLNEIEVEDGERKVKVSRGGAVATTTAVAPAMSAPVALAANESASMAETAQAATPAPHANALKSPMVGTVYLSAEPGAPPFVKVGDTVQKGDTVLIVEAMKVMNPITAEHAGKVEAVLVDNAQPVEFDQPLIVIT